MDGFTLAGQVDNLLQWFSLLLFDGAVVQSTWKASMNRQRKSEHPDETGLRGDKGWVQSEARQTDNQSVRREATASENILVVVLL